MLRWLFRKTQAEEELDAELHSYIDHAADEKIASGLTPEEARRAALIEFGGIEQVKERVRTSRAGARIDAAIADCRYALRALRRRPSFATIAILTMALGIGAATAMSAVVDNVLLRPLKHRDSEQLVTVWGTVTAMKADTIVGDFWNRFTLSYEDYQNWLHQQTVFEDTAIFATRYARFAGDQETRRLSSARASENFFTLLGTSFFQGRSFEGDEKDTVVITYEFRNKALGADPKAIGRKITLDGAPKTVVVILPRHFDFAGYGTNKGANAEVWQPLDVSKPSDYCQRGLVSTSSAARQIFLYEGYGSLATAQASTDYSPRRRRAEMAQSSRQGLPDAHQSNFAGCYGEPIAAPITFDTKEDHPIPRRTKTLVNQLNNTRTVKKSCVGLNSQGVLVQIGNRK